VTRPARNLTVLAADGVVATDRSAFLEATVRQVTTERIITDVETVVEALLDRERIAPTDVGDRVAVPHATTSAVSNVTVIVSRPATPVRFSDRGEPVSLVVILLVPDGETATYTPVFAAVARTLLDDEVREALREASDPEELRRQFAHAVDRELAVMEE